MTVGELATRHRVSEETMCEWLHDFEARGIVEQHAGRWRLTASAEKRYGQALRDMTLGTDVPEAA